MDNNEFRENIESQELNNHNAEKSNDSINAYKAEDINVYGDFFKKEEFADVDKAAEATGNNQDGNLNQPETIEHTQKFEFYQPQPEQLEPPVMIQPESGSGSFKVEQSKNIEQDNPISQIFYKENFKKTKTSKRFGIIQLIAVALISSIIGGSVVGGILVLSGKNSSDGTLLSNLTSGTTPNDSYTKVVIDSSGSPVSAIASKVNPSIVGIKVTFDTQDFFLGNQQGTGEGSGIIIKSDGYIMTNNHVIADAVDSSGSISSSAKIEVILPSNINKSYTAKIIGRDSKTDLAVLKINATGLPAAELGDSDKLKIGELAVAVGNPGGLDYMGSVTVGVISGLNRTISPEDPTLKLIQTDAAINPGNSGGALVNSKGQVIGINSAKIVATGFEGLGFAIPINTAKTIVDSLLTSGYVKGRPFLGIQQNPDYNADIAKQNNLPEGVLVDGVVPLSGAYKAGFQKGDIITKFDGTVITDFNSLNDAKNKHKPGDTVTVEVYRDNKTIKLKVTLTEQKN